MSSPRIEQFRFGRITVDGRCYTCDVIIHAGGVNKNWWRAQSHCLGTGDLKPIFDCNPQVLVVGTGSAGMMAVPDETRQMIQQRGIQLVVEKTEPACQIYNQMSGSQRTVAALHLTC